MPTPGVTGTFLNPCTQGYKGYKYVLLRCWWGVVAELRFQICCHPGINRNAGKDHALESPIHD